MMVSFFDDGEIGMWDRDLRVALGYVPVKA
jgi:hypothetical protein